MKIKYYLRFLKWIPHAFLTEFAYRFWMGEKSTRFWRDCNRTLYGPNMTLEEYNKWFVDLK